MSEWGKGGELLELETVQRSLTEASQWAGSEFARQAIGYARFFIICSGQRIESPIEAIFSAWFNAAASLDRGSVYGVALTAQHQVELSSGKRCRFDFIVRFNGEVATEALKRDLEQPRIAIELDGHDFHERSKEQVAERNTRDRDAQADGWTILHFSGSELYRDPVKCVEGVMTLCRDKHDTWIQQVYGK